MDALRRAYERHKKRLLTMAFALTGDRGAAEDVVHDVFARLLQNSSWPNGKGALRRYLVVCVRNGALDWLRHRQRHRPDTADRSGVPSQAEDPAAAAVREEEAAAALEALHGLAEELRDVVVMRIWGELPFRQIARLQGIGKSAAHERYNRALAEVRKRLTGARPK